MCKSCQHVFRSKRKAEHHLPDKAMKRMRVLQSDSVKSAIKAVMPPSKVCPQCESIVPLRLKVCKSCQHVFRSKRKAEHHLPEKTMKRMRVLQSDSVKSAIKAKDRLQKDSERASETSEQTVHRQQQNTEHMASMRASETSEQTVHRQEKDRNHKASMRASETSEQSVHRQGKDKSSKASVRATKKASDVSVQQAVMSFHSDVKNGPDFGCSCCHRLMYSKSVVPCNIAKYTKSSNNLLECVFSADLRYVSDTGKEWVCKTCDRTLKRGVMPLQAIANGLQLSQIPPKLSDLNALELRLICLRVPFMKMVALPSGKQRSIHGPAVNVPSKVDTICSRLPSQSELVPLKLKRKLAYRGHYMYDYITPQKLLDALTFLKANNSLYADIAVNEEWLEAAMANNAELCECLVEQQDDSDEQPNDAIQPIVDSKNSVAPPNAPNEIAMDDTLLTAVHKLETIATQNGFTIHDVLYDGNCMFSAVAYQLNSTSICDFDSNTLRQTVADYLGANRASYCDFLFQPVAQNADSSDYYNADTEPQTREDEYINSIADPELQTELRWQKYLTCLEQGAWGDNIAMQAISDMLNVTINVLSSHYPVYSVTPRNHCADNEVFVGLIMQYHYVGFDKLPEQPQPTMPAQPETIEPVAEQILDNELDDATIEQGDEHRRLISGTQQATMMCVENPESFRHTMCVAPAEGERPLNIMTDLTFEAMSNPDKFPYGTGTFSSDRPKKL